MPYVKVNDIQMYYEIHGDGEPLVLIVGLGTDISEWGGHVFFFMKERQQFLDTIAEFVVGK